VLPHRKLNKLDTDVERAPIQRRLTVYQGSCVRVALVDMVEGCRTPSCASLLPQVFAPLTGTVELKTIALENEKRKEGKKHRSTTWQRVCSCHGQNSKCSGHGAPVVLPHELTPVVHHKHTMQPGEASVVHPGCVVGVKAIEPLLCVHVEFVRLHRDREDGPKIVCDER
jgi:hypothetical protein